MRQQVSDLRSTLSKIESKDSKMVSNKTDDKIKMKVSNIKEQKLKRLLYPSLPLYEISFLTAWWAFVLVYSMYLVFLTSRQYYNIFLSNGSLKEGMFSRFS